MIPENFYMTGIGFLAYLALYVPLVSLISIAVYIKLKSWPLVKSLRLVVPALFLALLIIPLWDVYMIARDAERLCKEQGGLHVYKTVEADGFLGGGGKPKAWLEYGYKYVEDGAGKYMSRFTMESGEEKHRYVKSFISQYYSKTGDNHRIITKSISRSSDVVVDMKTDEMLGELVSFHIYPGRFDGTLLRLLGSGPVLWHCGDTTLSGESLSYRDLVKATIKPLVKRKAQ